MVHHSRTYRCCDYCHCNPACERRSQENRQNAFSGIRRKTRQYFKEDGTPNNNGDKIFSIEDGKELDGYKYEEGKIVTDDEKKTQLVVIWKVNTDGYEYTGYTRNSKGNYVKAYYCFGPSPYGMESWDSPTFTKWQEYGVVIEQGNPNAGSWVSTAFSVLMIVIMVVVFVLIIRSSMGGAGKVMSFAKSKARVSTNIKVRFSDVAGAEEEKSRACGNSRVFTSAEKILRSGSEDSQGRAFGRPSGNG